jgi:hypothetical protein
MDVQITKHACLRFSLISATGFHLPYPPGVILDNLWFAGNAMRADHFI